MEFPEGFSERFWAKVDIRGPDECWPWKYKPTKAGYGQITARKVHKHNLSVHRVAWELTNGEIPNGLCVLHTCDNRPCCNPAHLFIGTHQDNMNDCRNKGRVSAKLTDTHVAALRKEAAEGVKQIALATKYGVAPSTVCDIVNGKRRK